MKSGLDFYKKDTAYRMLKKEMLTRYGKEQTDRIWEKAGQKLEQLWKEFPDVPKTQRHHTHGEIFPRVAMYRALQEELPKQAMAIMDDAVRRRAGRQADWRTGSASGNEKGIPADYGCDAEKDVRPRGWLCPALLSDGQG